MKRFFFFPSSHRPRPPPPPPPPHNFPAVIHFATRPRLEEGGGGGGGADCQERKKGRWLGAVYREVKASENKREIYMYYGADSWDSTFGWWHSAGIDKVDKYCTYATDSHIRKPLQFCDLDGFCSAKRFAKNLFCYDFFPSFYSRQILAPKLQIR